MNTRPATMLPAAVSTELQARFGSRYSTAAAVRDQHARGESPFPPAPPDAVVYADTIDDVQAVMALCHAHRVPVIAFGAGSSLEGQLLAVRGGVSLDMSRINRIQSIDAEDFTATVQAGVTREQLNQALKESGLFFPVDPGAHASLGGMAATRASGTNTVRYGSMRENVLALTVVMADGRIVRTGGRAMKSAAGYDLTRLFVGSEGTLGVITEVTVRLYPLPESVTAAVVGFPDAKAAVSTVIAAIQSGLPIARSEYLCAKSIRAINQATPGLNLRERPTLFLEFHGSPAAVEEQSALLREIADMYGGEDFDWAARPEDRTRLWQARHNAYYACRVSRAGAQVITTDTCVPRSRLAECIARAGDVTRGASFPTMIFGHVGDGNFHVLMIVDPANEAERHEAEAINAAIVDVAMSAGGTCSGEHGIGYHKKDFLLREAGASAVDLMRDIKALLDPHGILNPEKIF
ncbi:MAG TPA: FAD-linked oxidase C-terminal domain-containing protein [Ramlibacter sp.]|nr:FAD-linked oxidase C-terminal domain-containing protein [Ramlibacter sp.]